MILLEWNWTAIGAVATAVMAVLTGISLCRNRKQYIEQFAESKKQYDAQLKESREQLKVLLEQNFENGFLNRMDMLKDARRNVYDHAHVNVNGSEAFAKACYSVYNGNIHKMVDGEIKKDIVANYKSAIGSLHNIQSYYDALESVLFFVRKSEKVIEYQRRVMNGLTDNEKKWLAIYCDVCRLLGKNDGLYIELQELGPMEK